MAEAVSDELLPAIAGPVADRLTIWPVDDGRYGLDATFHGATGFERVLSHEKTLEEARVPHTFRQEVDGSWTIRLGPMPAAAVWHALASFVY